MIFKATVLSVAIFAAAFVSAQDDCFVLTRNENGGSVQPITKLGLYLSNQDCRYDIKGQLPAGLAMSFTKFDLEVDDTWKPCKAEAYTCADRCTKNDWVALLQLPSQTEITRRCDSNVPTTTYRTVSDAQLWFHTDGNIQRSGFTMEWKVDQDTLSCNTASAVTRASGSIASFVREVDNKYRANEDCRWLITVPKEYNAVRIFWNSIDIQGSCSGTAATCTCNNDWVAIHQGKNEDAPVVTRRCGVNAPSTSLVVNGNQVYVRFKTDATVQQKGFSLRFEGTVADPGVVPTAAPQITPWPREDVLEGYWPLDQKSGLKDSSPAQHKCNEACTGTTDSTYRGPFGAQNTAHKSSQQNIALMKNIRSSRGETPTTISFFVRAVDGASGSIVSLNDASGRVAFEVQLIEEDGRHKLRTATQSGAFFGYPIAKTDGWTFASFVVNFKPTCSLSVYGPNGQVYVPDVSLQYCEHFATWTGVQIGGNLSASAPVACVSVHADALSEKEIKSLYESCRAAQSTVSCGAPRLPLSPVPSKSSTVPQHGQFPWTVSLRAAGESDYVCSAAILNSRYLLTSARCFNKINDPAYFIAHISDFDLAKEDTNEVEIQVEAIYSHPDFMSTSKALFGDVALVKLSEDISFDNDYVNAICLPEDKNEFEILPTDETYYIVGWGKNGRSQLGSQTAARYVAGNVLTPVDCRDYYPYSGICFQAANTANYNVPCNGDEGALLLKETTNTFAPDSARLVPVGLYSRRAGDNCGNGQPALFTPLSPYVNWIKEILRCNDCQGCTACQ